MNAGGSNARQKREPPDPFEQFERDNFLDYYRKNRPFKEYAFLAWQFWQGTRPSEAAGLKWGAIDIKKMKARISASRHLREEHSTKTAASDRTIDLMPTTIDILKQLKPAKEKPDDYVFTNEKGLPIDQAEFGRKFGDALRVLEVRQRRFYNCRHTWFSIALSAGIPVKYVAEQGGTSIQMLQANYGKFLGDTGAAKLRALYSPLYSRPARSVRKP